MFMPIENIPDYEMRLKRQDAYWDMEVLDRAVVCMYIPNEKSTVKLPAQRNWKTLKDRWFDAEYNAELALAIAENTIYFGDALPIFFPNLGPEVFSAFCGCELEYSETTSWAIPIIKDWKKDFDKISFSEDNVYFKKIEEMTDLLLEYGKGKFYTGLTDIHPGGDGIAAFRDPQEMNYDMLLEPEMIKKTLNKITPIFFKVFDHFYNKLAGKNQVCGTWNGMTSIRKYHIPSNDFSCMISNKMFKEFFLQGIIDECKYFGTSIYHLDGPQALQHLDDILDIKELNGVQWVPGTGNGGRYSNELNLPILQKIQNANKVNQFHIEPDELDTIMENLKPNGIFLTINGVKTEEEGQNLIKKIENWK